MLESTSLEVTLEIAAATAVVSFRSFSSQERPGCWARHGKQQEKLLLNFYSFSQGKGMEVAEPLVHRSDGNFSPPEQRKGTGRRWKRHWVPQDTVLGSGKCFLLKWVTGDALNTLSTREPVEDEQEREQEHETVYLCTFEGCGKVFPEASGLRKHAHIHGEKQYICHYDGCGKRFVDSSKLKRHFLIHTGEKHFICPFEGCGKAFSLDFNLRSHMRTHTGENYHICPVEECGKRYAHEYKLKAHLRTYHDKNIPENNIVSPQVEPEREREIVVPPTKFVPPPPPPVVAPPAPVEKPFGCPVEGCSKRYIHEYKLNLHLKSAHMVQDTYDEVSRPRASEGEDDIEEASDQDVPDYEEPVQRYFEPPPPARLPSSSSSKKQTGSKPLPPPPTKAKIRVVEKPPMKSVSKKRPPPPEPTVKLNLKPPASVARNSIPRQEATDDSEETEDENENTEEEDNVQHMAGRSMRDDDDEETEDDMD
ncbi:hypothetical protein R1sor_006731 [Riccia sorocarpa]|uniref:C2H2-type domain-containing protein n=1 Tax=Riccia sorocarpa TaxID=122646 RepID=A0ABD3HSM1_9MARC